MYICNKQRAVSGSGVGGQQGPLTCSLGKTANNIHQTVVSSVLGENFFLLNGFVNGC